MKKIFLFTAILIYAGATFAHGDTAHGKREVRRVSPEEHAFGREGDARKAVRTVKVDMSDKMRFMPSSVTVKRGETVKFVIRNSGRQLHEMVIGSVQELKAHAAMMQQHPDMEHDEPYMAHVAPGKTGVIVWQFTRAGEFQFGCLVPGHFEAGMVGQIRVLAKGDEK